MELLGGLAGGSATQSGGVSSGGGFGGFGSLLGGDRDNDLPKTGINQILSEGVQLPEGFGGGNIKSNVNVGQIRQNVTPQLDLGNADFAEIFRQFITGGF